MKLKKTILGLAVVAVAGVNAWLANDVRLAKNDLSLVNLENVADASEFLGVVTECDVTFENRDKTVTRMYCDDSRRTCEYSNPGEYSPFGTWDWVSCDGYLCTITVG